VKSKKLFRGNKKEKISNKENKKGKIANKEKSSREKMKGKLVNRQRFFVKDKNKSKNYGERNKKSNSL
jgi:hypothetical protein